MNRRAVAGAVFVVVVAVNAVVVLVALTRDQRTTQVAALAVPSSNLTLVDPGAAPHRVLRFDPEPGAVATGTVSSSGWLSMSTDHSPDRVALPAVELDWVSTVTDVDGDRITVELRLVDHRFHYPGIPASAEDQVREQMQHLVDSTRIERVLDHQGVMLEGWVEMDDELLETSRSDVTGWLDLHPLPEQPVGEGAVWEITGTVDRNGATMTSTARFTLVELTTDHAVALIERDSTVRGSAARSERWGEGVEILSGTHDATGQVTWHFDHPEAMGDQRDVLRLRARVLDGGQRVTATIEQTQNTENTRNH